ncbi:unnamed protein product [marine sediment metagenome]|jgi:HEPN domain-containing protein|uniref:HEPN domain-containing protein n=3 Tax=marine sediment metagenome TaxID=412755 RepID=X1DII5_9ZZZZ
MDKRNELIKEWIHKADHDIGMAKLAIEHKAEYTDLICFHCQQAVEKYLKAYLVHLNIVFRKTHSLSYLLDLINEMDKISDQMYSMVEVLESYAVEMRYPDDWYEPTEHETREAYSIAIKIRKYILEKIAL